MDRNSVIRPAIDVFLASLSARRAWIEIVFCGPQGSGKTLSLSARRAWIEILPALKLIACHKSLSARRAWIEIGAKAEKTQYKAGRSPQGERG